MDHPALLTCPHGGARLGMCHALAWQKTVPTLDRVLAVARRPARPPRAPRSQMAQPPGGVRIALDGLAPQGGEPHLGVRRARPRGVTVRSGGRSPPDPPPFAAFLPPLQPREGPRLAGRSAQHT